MVQGGRKVNGLKYAAAVAGRPASIPSLPPISSIPAAKAAGLRLERSLHKALPSSIHGQWFEFEDALGHSYCQTDLLYPLSSDFCVVIEVKYTFVPGAHSKLAGLYVPVVEKALGVDAAGVVIVKNLDPRYRRGRIFTDLRSAAESSFLTKYPTLIQWSGQALLPSPRPVIRPETQRKVA